LGGYEVVRQLGAGGMGEVYLARDTTLDRMVALKLLPVDVTSDSQRVARFEREARPSRPTFNAPKWKCRHSTWCSR
jgi:eukaryotic-like serine/threonine-protein kinase